MATPSSGPGRGSRCRQQRRCPGGGLRGARSVASPASSSTPRCCTLRTGNRCWSASCTTSRGSVHVDAGEHRRTHRSSRCAAQVGDRPGDLRAVRRRRLRGGRGTRAPGGRRPTDAVCSSTTACCARASASRWSATTSAPPGIGHRRRRAERFLEALPGVTDPEEKRKIIGRQFIRTFEDAVQDHRRGGRQGEHRVPRAGNAVPRRRRVRRWDRHGEHQEPPQRRRAARRPRVRAHRTAAPAVQGRGARGRPSWGCPRQSLRAIRSPGPGLAIRIVGEVNAAAPGDAAAGRCDRPGGVDRGRAGHQIWQFPVVLLADVRSVGVQGDGRTYGHPWCCGRCPARTP